MSFKCIFDNLALILFKNTIFVIKNQQFVIETRPHNFLKLSNEFNLFENSSEDALQNENLVSWYILPSITSTFN